MISRSVVAVAVALLLALHVPVNAQVTKKKGASVPPAVIPQKFVAKVVGVLDGDTLRVANAEISVVTLRLEGIDAPELSQDFGVDAPAGSWIDPSLSAERTVSSIGVDGVGQLLINSNAHGLVEGARVFVRGFKGIQGIPDGYYGVDVVNSNQFALVGTSPQRPFGSMTPTQLSWYYEPGKAQWGLADAIQLGGESTLDLSEIAVIRQCVAPVLIQSVAAQLLDPIVTIPGLRLRYDPGAMESPLGMRAVIRRDEWAAASASGGGSSVGGGLVGNLENPF